MVRDNCFVNATYSAYFLKPIIVVYEKTDDVSSSPKFCEEVEKALSSIYSRNVNDLDCKKDASDKSIHFC